MSRPFPRVDGALRCGEVPLADLAERFGTPLYVYDIRYVEEQFRSVTRSFDAVDHLVAYSVKANGNLALLHRLGALGAGADIVSLGELYRARRAGIPADRIVFAGVAKSEEELRAAIREGIYAFNVESRGELERLERIAGEAGVRAPFAVRVNPDIVSPTPHEYTRTGHAGTKFGVPAAETLDLYRWARDRRWLDPKGIDVHIGSQILEAGPYRKALGQVMELVGTLRGEGVDLDFVDVGGGFGVRYGTGEEGPELRMEEVAEALVPLIEDSGLRLVLEPGRFVAGEAGVLLTRVEYVKRTSRKTFVVVDGGMTELIRPSHYGGWHAIEPSLHREGATRTVDVVGPICEAGDFLARDRTMVLPEPGELLVVRTAGAYGFTMASNYNARRRPAEAMVDGSEVWLVRERETLDDLIRGETIPWEGETEP